MFRRLHESFANTGAERLFSNSTQSQQNWYGTKLPNLIPSNQAAPSNLGAAFQSVEPQTGSVKHYLPNVSQIFRPGMDAPGPQIMDKQEVCTNTGLTDLIRNQNPTDPVKCGWLYTPNTKYGAAPLLSRGFLADSNGLLKSLNPPDYTKYFSNLQDAEQQIETDRCKTLQSCNELSNPLFAGCGFSTEKLMGIPVNENGSARYPDNLNTYSSPTSIITDANSEQCKKQQAQQPAEIPGSKHYNALCTPNEFGLLSVPCFHDSILKAGCSADGAMAAALQSGTTVDPLAAIQKLDSAQLYNQRSHDNPFYIEVKKDASPTIIQAMLIKQIHDVYKNAIQAPAESALGAAARDLCISKGSIAAFDFCTEILDTTPIAKITEDILGCLQKEFKRQGGTQLGAKYPSPATVGFYQSHFKTYGAAKQYMATLNAQARMPEGFADITKETQESYKRQAAAIENLRGITLDSIVDRAPETAGVEVFWYSNGVLIKNTIEATIPYIHADSNKIPETAIPVTQLIAITDIRMAKSEAVNLYIAQPGYFRSDGTWKNNNYALILNGLLPPADDPLAPLLDKENQFRVSGSSINSPLIKTANCWYFRQNMPNILKILWNLTVPTVMSQRFSLSKQECNNPKANIVAFDTGALTREREGPFLMYSLLGNTFADARCPERFAALTSGSGVKNRADDILRSPGTEGYLALTNTTCIIPNLSILSWTTLTFVFCLNTIPITPSKLFTLQSGLLGSMSLQMTRKGDTQASIDALYTYRDQLRVQKKLPIPLDLSKYYLCTVAYRPGNIILSVSFYELESALTIMALSPTNTLAIGTGPDFFTPAPATLTIGDASASGLNCNLSWLHLFNNAPITPAFLKREAANDWKITK
jgi:hypothetical protein